MNKTNKLRVAAISVLRGLVAKLKIEILGDTTRDLMNQTSGAPRGKWRGRGTPGAFGMSASNRKLRGLA